MEPDTQDREAHGRSAIESQLRECFGRVVYSHKTHEKSADRVLEKLGRIKFWQIVLSAVTTGGILVALFGKNDVAKTPAILAALLSTLLLALNTYTKGTDLGQLAQKHKEAADKLWSIRESYLSLLTDLHDGSIELAKVREKRDIIQTELAAAYASAPRTTAKAYGRASKGLKEQEELTFSDAEIDKFLPAPLRRTSAG